MLKKKKIQKISTYLDIIAPIPNNLFNYYPLFSSIKHRPPLINFLLQLKKTQTFEMVQTTLKTEKLRNLISPNHPHSFDPVS